MRFEGGQGRKGWVMVWVGEGGNDGEIQSIHGRFQKRRKSGTMASFRGSYEFVSLSLSAAYQIGRVFLREIPQAQLRTSELS